MPGAAAILQEADRFVSAPLATAPGPASCWTHPPTRQALPPRGQPQTEPLPPGVSHGCRVGLRPLPAILQELHHLGLACEVRP